MGLPTAFRDVFEPEENQIVNTNGSVPDPPAMFPRVFHAPILNLLRLEHKSQYNNIDYVAI